MHHPTITINPSSPARLYFLDWLRIAAFGLLVLYHVGMYYVSWDWHVKSAFASAALEPFMRLSSPWRLSLLFVLSGAATSLMLQRDGASAALLGQRSKRLLLPLLFGMAVIVPLQPYFEVVQKFGYGGSYVEFMRLYFTGYSGFCSAPGRCLILPTWNHLWFVAYLFAYTLALWVLVKAWPKVLDIAARGIERSLHGALLLIAPIAVLALMRALMVDRFPPTHALAGDWYLHASYFALFVVGAALARAPVMWQRLAALRWPALVVAALAWLAMDVLAAAAPGVAPAPIGVVLYRTAFAAMQWSAIVAALGFAHLHLDRDHAWRRYLTDAVFPVYIVHQTLIVGFAVAASAWSLRPWVEAPLLVIATFACSFAAYEGVRRVGWLRPWFGLRPRLVTTASSSGRLGAAANAR